MAANRNEAIRESLIKAGNYVGHVAERTVGIAGWKRGTELAKDNPKWIAPWTTQVVNFSADLVCPFSARLINSLRDHPQEWEKHNPILFGGLVVGAMAADLAVMALCSAPILLGRSPLESASEIITFRLAANAASQVGLDLVGAAVKRIKHFRPHIDTLAA